MRQELIGKIDTLNGYYQELKQRYKWSANDYTLRFTAYLFAINNSRFDLGEFEKMVKYIKKNTGFFSHHRAAQLLPTAGMLTSRFEQPAEAFNKMLKCEEIMKQRGFKSNPYLGIAAYALLLTCEENDLESRVERALEIYKAIKKEHPFLTTADDYPLVVLLAQEQGSIENIVDKIERNYAALHQEGFKTGNGLQFLSHLLTFNPEPPEVKAHWAKHCYDYLREHKLKVTPMYYGTIGFLAMLGEQCHKALGDVVEGMKYLKSAKIMRWGSKELNLMLVSALVNDLYLRGAQNQRRITETGLSTSIQAVIAAQTAALIAASSAAAAAAASSSSSS